MTDPDTEQTSESARPHRSEGPGWLKRNTPKARVRLARLIWLLALTAALVLGLGALLIALNANEDNVLVGAAVGAAAWLDGPFADVFTFSNRAREVLVNWGLAAVAYLVAGGILARLVRP